MSEANSPMANKSSKFINLSNGNQIQRDQFSVEQNDANEIHSLLIKNDPSKQITLLKPNTGSFIYTKKETNPTVHRKNGTYHRPTSRSATTTSAGTMATATADTMASSTSTETEIWSSKRHSFHWHSERNDKPLTDDTKRKQVKSWYAANDQPTNDDVIFFFSFLCTLK